MTHTDMPTALVALVQAFERLDSSQRRSAEGQALKEKIQIAGMTASFFGGFAAMKRLHDAAEALVGNDNSIGYRLNYMWDGIRGWSA